MKFFAMCALAVLGIGAEAAEYIWAPDDADPANVLTNACHFPTNPENLQPDDMLVFSSGDGDLEVTLPNGCDWTSRICPSIRVGTGGSITFDMPEATWAHADLSEGSYPDTTRFGFYAGGDRHLYFTASSDLAKGAFRFDDANFSVKNTAGTFRFDLNRGTMDMLAPNGTALNSSVYWPVSKNVSNSRLLFHAGSRAVLPTLLVYAMCPTNEIVVDGGSHYMKELRMRLEDNNSDDGALPRTRVTVTGEDTELALGKFVTGNGHTYAVNVVSNAVLTFTGSGFVQTDVGTGRIAVDGASLLVTNIAAGAVFTATTPDVYVTNGTVTVSRTPGAGIESGSFFKIADGGFTLVDSTFTVDNFGLNNSPVIDLTRTCFSVENKFYMGYNGRSRPVVNLRGGTFVFDLKVMVGESATSDAKLNLLDDVVSSGRRITIGDSANATGTVNVVSGWLTLSEYLVVGKSGSGTINVCGGTNECWDVRMCDSKVSGARAVFSQSGGMFTAKNEMTVFPQAGVTGSSALVDLGGGVLNVKRIYGGAGCSAVDPAQGGTAEFTADGGTVVARTAGNFIYGFNKASLGSAGLRIVSDYDIAVPQNFGNLPGAAGRLVLAGTGEKTVSGNANTISEIVVEEGSVVFAADARAASRVTVAGGAAVAFGAMGGTGCLTGLTVGDASGAGVVRFGEGDALSVSGDVDFVRVEIEFDREYPLGTTNTLFTCTSPVSASSLQAWADAFVRSASAEGTVSRFIAETGQDGVTAFKVAVTEPETLYVRAETADLSDSVDRTFASGDTLVAVVSNGCTMTLSGRLSNGALAKVGDGRFTMTNPLNAFRGGVVSEAGVFDVASMAALGSDGYGDDGFTLRGGTLEFSDPQAGEFPRSLLIDVDHAGDSTNAAVLKVDAPVTVSSLALESGAIVKRGVGTLTIAPGPDTETVLSVGNGFANLGAWPAPAKQLAEFDDVTGASPDEGFTGFSVAEGEVVLKGGPTTVFSIPNTSSVGIRATPVSAQPVLTVDGAKLVFGSDTRRFLVGASVAEGDVATNAAFNVVNGAEVIVGSFVCANGAKAPSRPRVTIDASTVTCNFLNGGYDSTANAVPLFTVRNGGALYAKAVNHFGPADFDVSGGSVFGKNHAGECFVATLKFHGGDWRFRSGAEFRCADVVFIDPKTDGELLRLVFDGGKWITGGEDIVFAEPGYLSVTAEGEGLVLPVDEGSLRLATRVSGSGGIVKTGAGTLVVDRWASEGGTVQDDPRTLVCTGTNRVAGGTLAIAHSDAVAGASRFDVSPSARLDLNSGTLVRACVSGGGTVAGGTLDRATIVVAAGESAALQPLLDGVSFVGRTVFDISAIAAAETGGRTVVVARYAGAAPSLAGCRVRGQSRIGAAFEAADGEIRAALSGAGMMLLVR